MKQISQRLVMILALCGCSIYSSGQTNAVIDSLKILLAKTTSDSNRISLLYDLTAAFYQIDLDSAYHYNSRAFNLAQQAHRPPDIARGHINKGLMFIHQRAQDSAKISLQKGLTILQADPNAELSMFATANLGILHHYDANYQTAVAHYLESAEFAAEASDTPGISRAYYNIADVFKVNSLFNRSNSYFRKIMEINDEPVSEYYLLALISLADDYLRRNMVDSVRILVDEINDNAHIISNQIVEIDRLLIEGQLLLREDNYGKALPILQESINLSKALGDDYRKSACYCNFAVGLGWLERYSEAEGYFQKFQQLNAKVGNVYLTKECYSNYALILEKAGQFRYATELKNVVLNLVDSIYRIENRSMISDLEASYQSQKKDQDLAIQTALTEKRTTQRNSVLIALVGLVFLSILIYRFWHNKVLHEKIISTQKLSIKELTIKELEQKNQLLAMTSMLEGQEQERARIAQDLHDGLGALMATIRSHFNRIQDEIANLDKLNLYDKTKSLISEASEEVRRISHNMMPASLKLLGLTAAVKDLGDRLRSDHLEVTVEVFGSEKVLPENMSVMTYRIIQELAHNVIRHAEAHHLLLQLLFSDQSLSITVEDDGVGFDPAQCRHGLGLRSVNSRVTYLQGKVEILSQSAQGTSVQIEIPYPNL